MQFNPKYNFYLGIAVTIEIAISHGTIGFTNAIPAAAIPAVVAWAGILAFVGSTVMTYMAAFSSAQVGPLVASPPVTSSSPKVVIALAVGLAALGLGWPGAAHAQTRLPSAAPRAVESPAPAPAGPLKPICDPLNLLPGCHVQAQGAGGGKTQPVELDIWKKITDAALPDLDYASALAAAAGTPASGVRKQCFDALILVNKQASGKTLKNADGTDRAKPDPSLFSDVEALDEVLDNLAPGGPLWVACSGAAQLVKTNVLTLINGMVTGVAGMAALGVT